MDISKLINYCKQNFPERSIEICEGIDLIVDTLNNLRKDIGDSASEVFRSETFDEKTVDEYKNHAKHIFEITTFLNNISNDITINDTDSEADTDLLDESDSNDNIHNINYNDKSFDADSNLPHTIYEDFTYTKPAGIEIENTYLEANEWRDVFKKCCQYLLKKDKRIFMSFLNDPTMQGRTRKYFSFDKSELRDGGLVYGSNIYIECNVNAVFVRNIIIKMLEKYEIPKRNCHLFIRRDLTSLHNNNISHLKAENATKMIEASEDEIKIGQYAKEYFTSYFQFNISTEEINRFTNKEWCHTTFGICYPILKEVDIKIPISEQVNYNNQYRRYYTNPVLKIRNKHYIICSQWFSSFKPKLLSWIKNNNLDNKHNNSQVNKTIKLGKEYCGISLPINLFIFILKTIEQYKNTQFETGLLAANLSDIITKQTNYEKPHHVINNIRKYLEDKQIIALCENCKKGKYQIININLLEQLINTYSVNNQASLPLNSISYNSRVVVYSYKDKKQLIVNVGDMDDEFIYLHDNCVGKRNGDKFYFNAKEYVIVSFKNNKK